MANLTPRGTVHRLQQSLLLSALVFAGTGGPWSSSWAAVCNTNTSSSSFVVEDLSGAHLLNAAVNCSEGGAIEATWVGTVALDVPIAIGNATFLSVIGVNERATVQGSSSTRMFDVYAGGALSLSQLTLSGGTSSDGGVIYASYANLTLDGCVLYGNTASEGDGGAVWAEGSRVEIWRSEFRNNNASEHGGAMFVRGSELTIYGGTIFEANSGVQGGALWSEDLLVSLDNVTFASNAALDLGGAWAHISGDANVTASIFTENWGQFSAGGLFGGTDAFIYVDGCEFRDNVTPTNGGAMAVASAVIRGGTELSGNIANEDGGAIYAWYTKGNIDLEDFSCFNNTAGDRGGCVSVAGSASVANGTVMRGNVGYHGGCIYTGEDSNIIVDGGEFTCQATRNGGFLFADDGTRVVITSGLISNNTAGRRGAAVYCNGHDLDEGGPQVLIEGGSFIDNEALEAGGAIVAWGVLSVVTITGGVFENNAARYYGGFIFLELKASLSCSGAMIQGNSAGDQGGAIYARAATWVGSGCHMTENEAPQGAAAYLTYVSNVTLTDLEVAGSVLASGGSAVFIAASSVFATAVGFASGNDTVMDDEVAETTLAIQLDDDSTFACDGCTFDGWLGDTIILSANADNGSLILNSCDFRGSSAATAVISSYADAEIRNAVVGDLTLVNAENLDPLELVDRALTCADSNACGANGECVDSALGVLCECLPQSDDCLDDGGAISLTLTSSLDTVSYSPEQVSFELEVSAADDGTKYVIWYLTLDADELLLTATPSSGILPPGANATVTVTGDPAEEAISGIMLSHVVLTSVGGGGGGTLDNSTAGGVVVLNVSSTFYLCSTFQYALPVEDDAGDVSIECEQCTGIEGSEGVDCDSPGATLSSLPIREGYWRSDTESLVIYPCLNSDACTGGTEVSDSDDYCAVGYKGPYCAVCTEGYGQGLGSTCHSCQDTASSHALIAAGVFFIVAVIGFSVLAVAVLIGGLGAFAAVRRTMIASWSFSAGKTCTDLSNASGDRVSTRKNTQLATPVVVPARNVTALGDNNHGVSETDAGGQGLILSTRRGALDSSAERAERKYSGVGMPCDVSPQEAAGRPPFVSGRTNINGSADTDIGNCTPSSLLAGSQPTYAAKFADEEQPDDGSDGNSDKPRSFFGTMTDKMKRWVSRLPWGKLKILVVVWQILTVFPTITAVDFPPSYARFLSWINVVNFDLGLVFSASCLLPTVRFYERLLVTTLAPIGLVVVLTITYHVAKRLSGIGSRGITAKREAWSRHMAALLLLTFLVFTSASTMAFKTLVCDSQAVEGESYLRADYSISCTSNTYKAFRAYACIMIFVYPVGIPLLYFVILWTNRYSLNPRARVVSLETETAADADIGSTGLTLEAGEQAAKSTNDRNLAALSPEKMCEIEEQVRLRMENPDLVPSMFLWKDFGPELYYYEVIECGRRILLTGVLIFIRPYSDMQAAVACIFAFASLLAFELLRPHLDDVDKWLYRLGCVIIFLSNFLALLIKVDAAAGESGSSRDALGALLVVVNVFLVVAVLVATWFATQQEVDESREEDNMITMAKAMASAEGRAIKTRNKIRSGRPSPAVDSSEASVPAAEESVRASFMVSGGSTSEKVGSRPPLVSRREARSDRGENTMRSAEGPVSSTRFSRGVLTRQHGHNHILRDVPYS